MNAFIRRGLRGLKNRMLLFWRRFGPRRKVYFSRTLSAAANIALGIGCVAFADGMYRLLPYLMGIMMMLSGLTSLAVGILRREYRSEQTQLTASGIVSMIVGLIIALGRGKSYGLVGVFWGISGLNRAVGELNLSISRIANGRTDWKRLMLFAIWGSVISVLLLTDPLDGVYEHMVYIGLELIFIGIDEIDEMYFEES